MEPVQLFMPYFRVDECLEEIRECLEKGWTGLGFKTTQIEDRWKEYTGLPHAHFTNSATAALHIALALLKEEFGWREDDEVITTPLTFVSTNHAIRYVGMQPVFADVDEYLCLDPESVESRITERTRAVVFVGMGGNTGQLQRVAEICRNAGISLVLDAAHMAGTKLRGEEPGEYADVTCYSFQAVKNLPTGDSGMVCFRDADLDRRARQFSWLGINKDTYSRWYSGTYSWRYEVDGIGYKYHGNSVMASLALVGLRYLDLDNAHRRTLAASYDSVLERTGDVSVVPVAPGCESSRHLYQVLTPRRDELMAALHSDAIYPGVHYRCNTDYEMYKFGQGTCPNAELAASELISLPMHVRMSSEDAVRVGTVVRGFLQGNVD